MTAKPTAGLFGYIFSQEGKLFVKKRGKNESLAGEWDLPGGGVEEEVNANAKDERVVIEELLREIHEETGYYIPHFDVMPAMYPAVSPGGKDWAFGINVGMIAGSPPFLHPGNYQYVSPEELEKLANGSPGNRIVSGYGKRMHRLCLLGLEKFSPNNNFREQAGKTLQKIWETWD